MLAGTAVTLLAFGAFGCAHDIHQAKSDAHHDRAKRDAKDLHFGDAMHQQHESNVEQRKADDSHY
jgi:hypothetical protein